MVIGSGLRGRHGGARSRAAWGSAAALLVMVATACTPSDGSGGARPSMTTTSPVATKSVSPGASGCRPASPMDTRPDRGLEVQGTGQGATLYGLVMTVSGAVRAGEEVKIVWRMTGSGPLHLSSVSPDGTSRSPVWGPEPHGSSNYHRPGDEWGVGYQFPTPGCWHLRAERSVGSADVWLQVID